MAAGAEPSLRHFLLTVAYDGGEFHGWQRQRGERSVQGEIESVLARLTGGRVALRGSGRTDAGVHALGQLAAFSAATRMGAAEFRRALNALLPASVRVTAAVETPAAVDPRRGARRKTYVYQFHLGDHLPPDRRRHFVLAGAALDVAAMRRAAALLCGVHDFSSFARSSAARRGAVRRIDAVRVRRISRGVRLFVTGSGFLYNMVRTLASALLEVGRGRCGADEVAAMLAARDRRRGPATLPPQGLFLWRVELDAGGRERAARREATSGGSTDPTLKTKGPLLAEISLTVRHGPTPNGIQQFATEKCSRLEKFLRGNPRIEIVLERDKESWKGEAILHGSRHHERIVAHEANSDAQGCVERLVEKIERQLGRSKERRKDHHVPPAKGSETPATEGGVEEPSYEEIVRRELKDGGEPKKKP